MHYNEPPAQKPWILEHATPVAPEHHFQQHQTPQPQQQQQEQAVPPAEKMEPELTRREERAKARNEARGSNRTAKKQNEDDSIWEVFYLSVIGLCLLLIKMYDRMT